MTDHHDKIIGDAVNVCPPPDAKRRHGTDHCTIVQRSVHQADDVNLFLPALTPILALITCTQSNTTPYVVVSGVERIFDTFTLESSCFHNKHFKCTLSRTHYPF